MSGPEMVGIAIAGVVVGALSAMFGVGGGVVMVPFMVLVLEKTQHVAEGTSLLVIVPTAIAGVLMHRRNKYVSFRHSLLLAGGGVAGAYLGALLALNLSADTLQTVFGVFLALVGARTVRLGFHTVRRQSEAKRANSEDGEDDVPSGPDT